MGRRDGSDIANDMAKQYYDAGGKLDKFELTRQEYCTLLEWMAENIVPQIGYVLPNEEPEFMGIPIKITNKASMRTRSC
jgi:hypothetical protein